MILINKQIKSFFNKKILYILSFAIACTTSTSVKSNPLDYKIWVAAESHESFPNANYISNYGIRSAGFQAKKDINKNISSQIAINILSNNKIAIDESFLEVKNGNALFGFGKINRNWSFSPNTSLILSKNARPAESIYFALGKKNKPSDQLILRKIPWSFEIFNSSLSTSQKIKNPMMLGMRAVIEPVHNLKFEFIKTSQWGGDQQNNNSSSLFAALLGNTNDSKHSDINQLAGFGLSFLSKVEKIPLRFYAQFVGEDEAGSLPSCYMSLVGSEMEFQEKKLFSKIGLEFIDTRIDTSSHGYCGPNTAYNNGKYSYDNHGRVLGDKIDTEGKSINLWATVKISEITSINYSIMNVTINDANWNNHRLSSSKTDGWLANIEALWKINDINIRGNINYQNFSLDTAGFKEGISLKINTEYIF